MLGNSEDKRVPIESGIETPNGNPRGVPVKIQNVSKVYQTADGPLLVLKSMSLTIRAGEFLAVVGPSGCGKSTFVMVASGLIPATEGRVFVGEEEVKEPYTDLGFVFQKDVLMDWRTVTSNVLLPVEIRKLEPYAQYRGRASELLSLVGLDGFENRFPAELSGGMRQRVSISRALITNPPLLMMDEPFGALDAMTREQMNDDLQKIWFENQSTVIFITHNIAEAVYLADRVLVMSKRPAEILDLVDISDLPRPRSPAVKDMPEFTAHISHIRRIFINQGVLGTSV